MKKFKLKKAFTAAIFIAAMALCLGSVYAKNEIQGGILNDKVNGDAQDYGSYVVYGATTDTLFFTSSREVPKKRKVALPAEMFYSTRPAELRKNGTPINQGWSQAKQIVADASRIAQFTRGSQAISFDRIIFAAERDLSSGNTQGTSYLLDLWEMTKTATGFSDPTPLTNLNDADAWDSQPALSNDGKVLFFVSNRVGGVGGLDIWYSIRDNTGNWTAPKLVPNINTKGNEVSPHCGADGKFYFSSDWDYSKNAESGEKKDIFRCEYINADGLQMPVNPVILDEAIKNDAKAYGIEIGEGVNYNSSADDEFPFISPDRQSIFFTSNRKADYSQRNIFAYSLPKSKTRLLVKVSEQIFDANGNLLVPPTEKKGLSLSIQDMESSSVMDIMSGENYEVDADRTYQIKFSKFVEQECYQNVVEGPKEMKVFTKRPFGYDTLYTVDVLISRKKIEIPPIVFQSTDTLPYFVTGYWYPLTSDNMNEYRSREASGFFNNAGFVDSTGYNYDEITKKIDAKFKEKIYEPLAQLLPGFQDFCRDTLYLKITIHGYTDPRGLSGGEDHPYRPQSKNKHNYTDETVTVGVDERNQPVTISSGLDMWKQSWPKDPNNSKGTWIKLPNEGENGNVLLSKLRSYFTFVTFDRDMQKMSPIYSQIRDNGRIIVDCEGFGIDKEGFKERKLRDDPQSRRIEIYIDILRPEELAYHKRLPGGTIAQNPAIKTPKKQAQTASTEVSTSKKEPPTADKTVEKPIPAEESTTINAVELKKVEKPNSYAICNQDVDETERITTQVIPNREPFERKCYSIQYNTYESESEAQKAVSILKSHGVDDAKVLPYIDLIGSTSYRVRSGCYDTPQEAVKALSAMNWGVSKELNLTKKPIVVR